MLEEPVVSGAASSASCSRWPACSRSARSRSQRPRTARFEVYVVDNRGRLIAHSDEDRPPRRTSRRSRSSRLPRPGRQARRPVGVRAVTRRARTPPSARALQPQGRGRAASGTCSAPTSPSPTSRVGAWSCRTTSRGVLRRQRPAPPRGAILVVVVTALAIVLGTVLAGQMTRPIRSWREARSCWPPATTRHAWASAAATRSASSPRPSTTWARRSRRRSRRSSGGPRRTRSSSSARSACSPTRSTRRTPTRAATPSASPTTPRASPSTSA